MNNHDRMMAKKDDILTTIRALLPAGMDSMENYEKRLDTMYAALGDDLRIPQSRVKDIETSCVGHIDYAEKFALRLTFEYFGVE